MYVCKTEATDVEIADFIHALDIPVLDDTIRQELDAEISVDETKAAIRSFPNGQASGRDGVGAQFYKTHKTPLAHPCRGWQQQSESAPTLME